MDMVCVPRTDPAYNAHGYLTKVPEGAIRPFIELYTKPGDTILDPFAGSGMTGVAAYIAGRNAELSDISVLGRHIGSSLLNFVSAAELLSSARRIIQSATNDVRTFYWTICSACKQATLFGKLIWSYVYACPSCSAQLTYYDLIRANQWRTPTECPSCTRDFQRRSATRIKETPVLVSYTCEHCTNKEERPPLDGDFDAIAAGTKRRSRLDIPTLEIESDREMFRRSALGRSGNTETASFFTPRNAATLAYLYKHILQERNRAIRSKLVFAFTAILPRASKRYQWHHKRPLNAQNQTYYIAPIFYEWNVFDLFWRKVNAVIRADNYIQANAGGPLLGSRSKVHYTTASADDLAHLPDQSIDYVFTDPPFGSNMFYSDMSLFQEAWLGETTDHSREAVIHTSKKNRMASAARYEEVLTGALRECWRVLKPGSRMSVVFSNSRGEVWAMLQRAVQATGFDFEPNAITLLDKGQRSVKGLNSGKEGVVTADLVLTFRRNTRPVRNGMKNHHKPVRELVLSLLSSAPPAAFATPSHAYLHVIRSAVQRHFSLEPLHLSDVLTALHSLGYSVDRSSGRLVLRRAATEAGPAR